MFIFNVKVNGSKLFKVFFTFIIILMIIILCTVFYKVISGSNKSFSVLSKAPDNIKFSNSLLFNNLSLPNLVKNSSNE